MSSAARKLSCDEFLEPGEGGTSSAADFRYIRTGSLSNKIQIAIGSEKFNISSNQPELCSGLSDIVRRLNSLACAEKNWDSYGSDPLDQSLIPKVLELAVNANLARWVTQIFITPTGGVELSFSFGSKEMEVTLEPDGRIEAYYIDEQQVEDEWEPTHDLSVDEVKRKLEEIVGFKNNCHNIENKSC